MTLRTIHQTFVMGLLGCSLGSVACGDNAEIPARPDASEQEQVDAGPPQGTRAGTISIADAKVTTPAGASLGLRGASFSMSFANTTVDSPAPVFGTGAVGTCTVWKYTAGETSPAPKVDEGKITLGGDGLLVDVPEDCTFKSSTDGYECISEDGANPDGSEAITIDAPNGLYGIMLPGITDDPWPASYINGYLTLVNTGVANWDGSFPIVNITPTMAVVVNPLGSTADFTGGVFKVIQGFGPVPGGINTDFLAQNSTDEVTIKMEPTTAYPLGLDLALEVLGGDDGDGGFALGGTQPHEFPTTAADVTFSCAEDDGGNCGANEPTGDLTGIVIAGSTTASSVAGLPSFMMPKPVAGDEYTTFQCSFIGMESGTIPQAAVEAILDTTPAPTRIETRVFRVNGSATAQGANAENPINVLVGHALVGHTTVLL